MTLAQRYRRFLYRLRRRFSGGADNEPIVTIEGEAPARHSIWRTQFDRYARMIGGFAATLIACASIALIFGEAGSRVQLPAPAIGAPPENASHGVAVAAFLFTQVAEEDERGGLGRMFAPAALTRREQQAQAGIVAALRDYLSGLRALHGVRDPLFQDAESYALPAPDQSAVRAAESMNRLNAALARRQIVLDATPRAFAAVAREAANANAARAATLAQLLHAHNEDGRAIEAAFHEARGQAYAWRLLLRAAAEDSVSDDLVHAPELTRALEALDRAASYRPLFFSWGARGGAFAPNHLAILGFDLAVAAQELRTLSR